MTEQADIFAELERSGRFNEHINPIDWETVKPIDESFPYIVRGFWRRLKYAFLKLFVVKPFTWYQSKIVFKVKVEGRENLKGIKSAIITSNHIHIYDCLINKYVLRDKCRVVAAEFNNKKGKFGELMRIGGMIPLSGNYRVMRCFINAMEYYLKRGRHILFYPEQSMWYMYPKPRPFEKGAFKFAVTFGVPIVPMFITLRPSAKRNKDGSERKYFTVHIGKPLYADPRLSKLENTELLRNGAHNACVDIYEKAYGKKPEYET